MARGTPEAQVGLLVATFGTGALADDAPADVRSRAKQPPGLCGKRVTGPVAQHHPAFHRLVRRAEGSGRLALRRFRWCCPCQPRQRYEDSRGEEGSEEWFHARDRKSTRLNSSH